MVATVTTFAASLQRFYLPGVNKQLNDGTFLFQEMEKMKVKWTGSECVVHAWVSRNSGRGFSDGKLPTAGTQGTVNLTVTAKRFYGAFSVDGLLIESAPENGGHAFVDWATLEMSGLVKDCKFSLNYKTVSGGLVKGYLNEHKLSTTTAADVVKATADADASAAQSWEYSGHYDEFDGSLPGRVAVVTATETTWVPVTLIRMDTFNPVDYAISGGVPPVNLQVWVTGYDEDAGTIELRVTSHNAGTVVQTHGITTVSVAAGFAVALLIDPTSKVDSAAAALGRQYDATAVGAVTHDINGIFSCLSLPSYYSQTRHVADAAALPVVAADGTAPVLRCRVRTMNTAGNHARIAITGGRMERMKNIIEVESSSRPTSIFIHPYFKSTYSSLAILVQNVDATKNTGLNVGFRKDGYAHGETPMRSDRHVPRGLMIFYNKPTWKTCSLGEGKFADQDGSVFSRATNGRDEWEGFWRKYFNVVNIQPNANMILTGFALT